jgi:cation diffusion facilitator family transporter
MMKMASRKSRWALLSIFSNSFLIIIKVIVGLLSGSVSVISEAIHSGMDLIASVIAFFSVKFSDTPPDKQHPFGHGKYENVSGVIEAVLILLASVFIIMEAVKKLLHPEPIDSLGIGFIAMFISTAVNFFVSRKLYKVAKEEDSIALAADALHLKADVYTSLGVGLGLLILWITKLTFLDPVIAIVIALLILKEAVDMLREAYRPLLDSTLTDAELNEIKSVMEGFAGSFVDFHELRTRSSGKFKQVDLHLTVPNQLSTQDAHALCDRIEKAINTRLPNASILIHVEPCTAACTGCPVHSCAV